MHNGNPVIILTGPHAKCFGLKRTQEYQCDDVVSAVSKRLSKKIEKQKTLKVLRFINNAKLRKEIDYNRSPARKSLYRKRIRRKVNELLNSGERIILIDIHSFPPRASHRTADSYLYFIDGSLPFQRETVALANYLKNNSQFSFWIFHGEKNDIQDEFVGKEIPTILIEFNEELFKDINVKEHNHSMNENIRFHNADHLLDLIVEYLLLKMNSLDKMGRKKN